MTTTTRTTRRHDMPFGAAVTPEGGVRFRLWAPASDCVDLVLEDGGEARRQLPMVAHDGGWYALTTEAAAPGSRYRFRVGDAAPWVPDPASRYQPEDVHGPSQVVDPARWEWTDGDWRGRPWEEVVLYELHVGSFSPAGTFRGAAEQLDHLVDLGVTAIELMPVADFPGKRNWGYDGVLPFAPAGRYGSPEDLKHLVAAAHARGLMVFLDVVYNHFGPEGNYLHLYAPQFFTGRHRTPWGDAINFDGPDSGWVRQFFIHNACYWLEEYHLDGLRLDAVHAIFDHSDRHVLCELAETVRERVDTERQVHLVLENDLNAARFLERDSDGRPRWYVAQWSDDVHHGFHVATTGESSGYYMDYTETPVRQLGRSLAEGFAYQGDASRYRGGAPRGEPSRHLPPTAFVAFLQNHDQVGNRALGERLHQLAPPEAVRAATAVLLLAPAPPLLFMGQEWAADQPFPFFCDFEPGLASRVAQGRREEFARFPEFSDPAARSRIPDPGAANTFALAVLDWQAPARAAHRAWLDLHRQLLALRRREIVPRLAGAPGAAGEYHVRGTGGLWLGWRLGDASRLHLLANLAPGAAVDLPRPAGRRLLALAGSGQTEPAEARGVTADLDVAEGAASGVAADEDVAAGATVGLAAWSVLAFLEEHPGARGDAAHPSTEPS